MCQNSFVYPAKAEFGRLTWSSLIGSPLHGWGEDSAEVSGIDTTALWAHLNHSHGGDDAALINFKGHCLLSLCSFHFFEMGESREMGSEC